MKDAISQYGRIILTLIVILSLLGIIFGGIWFSRLRDTSDNLMKDPVSEEFVQRAAPTLYVQDQAAIVGRSFYIKGLVSALDADGVDISQYITITSEDGLYDSASGMFLSNKPGKYTLIVSISDPRAEEFSLSLTTTKKMIVTVNNTLDRYSINAKTEPHGLLAFNTTSAKEGTIIKIIPTPDVGYKFDGCKIEYEIEKTKEELAADGSNRYKKVEIELTTDNLQFTMPAADVLVTPKWSAIDVTVIFNGNGGKITGDDILTKKYGETYGGMPTVTKAGYVFEGWYTNKEGGILISDTTRVLNTSTHTLFAHWTVAEYTIKYKSDSTILSEQKVKFGSRIGSMPIPTKKGFVFSEWVLETDESKVFTAKTKYTLTSDITLIAKWTPSSGVIKFNPNGGTLSTDSKIIKYGQPYGEFPIPTLKGYNFLGWYTAIEGGNKVEETDVVLSVDTKTLYAHWELAKYKITFNAAGGIPATQTLSNNITYNSTLDLSSIQTPTCENCDFLGWFTSGVGGVPISTGSIFEYSSDITLYAHWTTKPITIRLHYCDEENTIVERKFYLKEKYGSQLNVFSRSGLDVRAWYTEYDETTKTYSGTQITKDTIVDDGITDLYARWSAKNITINFVQNPIPRFADAYAELPESITVEYGETLDISTRVPNAKSSKYPFVGWVLYEDTTDDSAYIYLSNKEYTYNFGTDINVCPLYTIASKIYFNTESAANVYLDRHSSRTGVFYPGGTVTVNEQKLYYIFDSSSELIGDFSDDVNLVRIEFSDNVFLIDDNAFKNCVNLKEIDLSTPKNIRYIGKNAFENTGITELFIPEHITHIDNYAFKNTNLKTLTFENSKTSTTSIKPKAKIENAIHKTLKRCDGATIINPCKAICEISGTSEYLYNEDSHTLYKEAMCVFAPMCYSFGTVPIDEIEIISDESIETENKKANIPFIPSSDINALSIKSGAFLKELPANNNGLNTPHIQNLIISDRVASIGDMAFALTGPSLDASAGYIDYLEFSENSQLTHIGNNAFLNALSKNVTHILNFDTCCRGIQNIGSSAFENCNIFGIVFPDPENDSDEIIKSSNTIVIGDNAFRNNPLSEHTVDNPLLISPAIKTLSAKCFENCGMKAVIVSDSVEECEENVFKGCNSLVNITIPCVYGDCFGYLFGASKYEENSTCVPSSLKSVTLSDKCTEMPDYAFYNCSSLTSVTIPDSVTSIGSYAFDTCKSLASVIIGNSVTSIGDYAFWNCSSLTSVTIPDSVTSIGYAAFGYCSSLTSVTIPDSVTSIGSYAFDNCKSLASVTIGNSVTSIGDWAFWNCSSLTSVTIPDSVTSICGSAFQNCSSLKSVTIGNGVTSIEDYAFRGCGSIETITIGDGLTTVGLGVFSDCNNLVHITMPCVYGGYFGYIFGAPDYTTQSTYVPSSLKSVTLSDKCTQIPNYAFYGCSNLTSVTIGNSVMGIGKYAFAYCSSLTSITIPNSVMSIGTYVFAYCSSLASVTISDGVINISGSAFYNCSGLTSVTIPDSVTSIGKGVFSGCTKLENITMPKVYDGYLGYLFGASKYEENPTYVLSSLKSVTLSDKCTQIPDYAFYSCSNLTSVTIGNSVTSIGNSAFYNCSGLTSIEIPNSVISINNAAFYDCSNIESVTIPDSVTSIGSSAFNRCGGITSLIIGNGVTSIGTYAFEYCSSLTSVTIPNNVTSIGRDAFEYCSSLTSVTISDSVTTIGVEAFYGCNSLTNITMPEVYGGYLGYLFAASKYEENPTHVPSSLTSVTLSSKCTEIPNYAFYNCSSLTSINLSDGLTTIGRNAFDGCTGLTSINIPKSLSTISDVMVFDNCSNLISINVDDNNEKFCSVNGIMFSKDKKTIVYYPCGKTDKTTYDIPNNVTTISGSAFSSCKSLTSVNIPDTVTSMGGGAFRSCSGLTTITIPSGVTSIGYDTFTSCTNLTEVNMLGNVTYIGQWAFYNCNKLISIDISNVTSIGIASFRYCSSLTSISIPEGVTTIPKDAFYGCVLLGKGSSDTVQIPNSVTIIGDNAFYQCESIKSITIPKNVATIGDCAFESCPKLATLVIQEGTADKSIGIDAFRYTNLTNATIPNSVKTISTGAFANCNANLTIKCHNGSEIYKYANANGITVDTSGT